MTVYIILGWADEGVSQILAVVNATYRGFAREYCNEIINKTKKEYPGLYDSFTIETYEVQ